MKTLPVVTILAVLTLAAPARADVFACLGPHGAVICHVTDSSTEMGSPALAAKLCNASCPACKNACRAERLQSEGGSGHGRFIKNPDADWGPNTVVPGPDNRETAKKIIEGGLVETPK
ncbi:hypothetical protein [Desulfolutivibrio sulfoxidireducens]|uniref:hypothetical protein n=1 Tax=Desulfolutivibrio sulfoxidireducens TaxID=2773299 RepID=UPI00159D864F|nr:hypothetical protein [Desulfolutivibrio sulfoxidireducens]QLA16545.1 hypothetical protein GD605_10675 [Desulfolutivibrio sulfoxidireducens]QLA19573.1 hypothetical protein GD604_07380 [Desulfolutivibrio sulfoxidireducens]